MSVNNSYRSGSTVSFASSTTISSPTNYDVYDKFTEIYYQSDMKERFSLISTITEYINHPVYSHLLKTMDTVNAYYIIGYLKSQRLCSLYDILEKICIDYLD